MKKVLAILLISVCVFAQSNLGTRVITDSSGVILKKSATDSKSVYIHYFMDGTVTISTTWVNPIGICEINGYAGLWFFPDTVGTAAEMDSLEIYLQPCDEKGHAAEKPVVWLNWVTGEADTARYVGAYIPGKVYVSSFSGFFPPCFGYKATVMQTTESASDSVKIPMKIITQ